jgi:hypothetical protein
VLLRARHGQQEVARGPVQAGREIRPRAQAARLLQPDGEQVRAQVPHLPGGLGRAHEGQPRVDELMRLVEHRGIHAGQQFGHATVAQRQGRRRRGGG